MPCWGIPLPTGLPLPALPAKAAEHPSTATFGESGAHGGGLPKSPITGSPGRAGQPEPFHGICYLQWTAPRMQVPQPKGLSQETPAAQWKVQVPFLFFFLEEILNLFPSGKRFAPGEMF